MLEGRNNTGAVSDKVVEYKARELSEDCRRAATAAVIYCVYCVMY